MSMAGAAEASVAKDVEVHLLVVEVHGRRLASARCGKSTIVATKPCVCSTAQDTFTPETEWSAQPWLRLALAPAHAVRSVSRQLAVGRERSPVT